MCSSLPRASFPLALLVLLACGRETTPVAPTPDAPTPQSPTPDASWARTRFLRVGGWRLDIPYAGEGLAIATDADGFAEAVFTSGHVQQDVVHRTGLLAPGVGDSTIAALPVLVPAETWPVASLFPDLPDGQRVRDLAVVPQGTGRELAALGRVFYQTAPQPETRLVLRALDAAGRPTGAARSVPVPLPAQEFSGFVKHRDAVHDLAHIGGGGYESGQGSVAGISYAVQRDGQWRRLLHPPAFGDLVSPRLPRDTAYRCPDGPSWVCLPPVAGRGVWSTERIFGGGIRLGDTVLFLPTLGYGERTYARQSATFGDPARDRVVLYRFVQSAAADSLAFVGYEPWPFTTDGQTVQGLALGWLRGVDAPVLFMLVGNAWGRGAAHDAPALLAFRIIGAS